MLKNNRLLYILPEMAFTATVGETPKEDYYFVQAFHQINGEFMKDENFVLDNLKKLFERVDEGVYTLVLPDFLFTDTIVNVPEIDDVKIAEHLRDQLLPRIEVSTFSHETRTSVLLQRKASSKVQLSAFEKELAATLKLAVGVRQIVLDEIVPLSWTLKAAVSLEPSLTIAQLGERLYLAEHYVGINQTVNAPLTDLDIIAETVKTLKGSDPNLQTTYLFTSVLVEERLKKFLLKTLPVQQLTEPSEDDTKIPSYVKQIVEVTARTLSLPEFAVPRFTLNIDDIRVEPEQKVSASVATAKVDVEEETVVTTEEEIEKEVVSADMETTEAKVEETVEEKEFEVETTAVIEEKSPQEYFSGSVGSSKCAEEKTPATDKTEPDEAKQTEEPAKPATDEKKDDEIEVKEEHPKSTSRASQEARSAPKTGGPMVAAAVFLPKAAVAGTAAAAVTSVAATTVGKAATATLEEQEDEKATVKETIVAETATVIKTSPEVDSATEQTEKKKPVLSFMQSGEKTAATETTAAKDTDQSQDKDEKELVKSRAETVTPGISAKTAVKEPEKDDKIPSKEEKKLVSKKKGGMGSFFKKLLLFLLIFVVTIALGIGVGLGILTLTGKDVFKTEEVPTPEPTVLPTPEPTPPPATDSAGASDSADVDEEEVDVAAIKVMVVNATGVAGLAGQTKTALEREGFTGVQTGNAKGTYDDAGTFVLMKERNSALTKLLDQATGKTLTYDEDYQVEDSAGTYDVVIVLNEE